jgi:hypothetical protein
MRLRQEIPPNAKLLVMATMAMEIRIGKIWDDMDATPTSRANTTADMTLPEHTTILENSIIADKHVLNSSQPHTFH